jgi:hypothetical protein
MMKRIVFMVTLALVMTAMMALAGGPALATIHPLANSECSSENASAVAQGQNPPGLSGQSQGTPPNNPTGSNIAQPVFAASGGEPFSVERPSPAFKTFGTSLEDLDAPYCPASK